MLQELFKAFTDLGLDIYGFLFSFFSSHVREIFTRLEIFVRLDLFPWNE